MGRLWVGVFFACFFLLCGFVSEVRAYMGGGRAVIVSRVHFYLGAALGAYVKLHLRNQGLVGLTRGLEHPWAANSVPVPNV